MTTTPLVTGVTPLYSLASLDTAALARHTRDMTKTQAVTSPIRPIQPGLLADSEAKARRLQAARPSNALRDGRPL